MDGTAGGEGGERTRHIAIRYFWVKDRVKREDVVLVHKGCDVCERVDQAIAGKPVPI